MELGDIGFYLIGERGGNQTDLVVHGCAYLQCDVDNYLVKQRSCPRSIGLLGGIEAHS